MAIFNTLTFDEENSLDYGVYITGEAVYNAPKRVVEMIDIPGKDGQLALDQGRFENIEVSYPAGCFSDNMEDFAEKVATFRNMLLSRYSYKRIEDDYNTDEFRLGLYRSGLEVDAVRYNTAGEFDIVFDCKPQRFLKSGEEVQTFSASGTITNPTFFGSRPLLVVTGAGQLVLGARVIEISNGSGANQVIYIDCESQEAWEIVSGGMVPRNDYIQIAGREFPTLAPGENVVTLGSGITNLDITPRWWRI